MVDSLELHVSESEKSEVIAKRALLRSFSSYNLKIDVNSCVPGMRGLPVLETASVKRADVNV